MTAVCPSGHESATTDYCDQCGAPIAATQMPAAPPSPPSPPPPDDEDADTSPAARREPCPVCNAPRSGDDRYCEGCGHDFDAPAMAPVTWEAVAGADRRQFDRFEVSGLAFPDSYRERRFALDGDRLLIGCRRGRPDDQPPEIDLAVAPVDPGISRRHAMLERQADGSYAVRDLGSTNGTTVNDASEPITPDQAVPLADGDTIRLGVWTTLTIRNCAAPAPLS
jgi:FHA domain